MNLLAPAFFDVIPALMPRLARVLQDCDLTVAEGFALSAVKHSDKELNGRPVLLLSELTDTLITVIGYEEHGGGAAAVTTKLFDRGLLERGRLTIQQKKALFGDARGSKAVAMLRPEGAAKLEEIKAEFNAALDLFLNQLPTGGRQLAKMISTVSRLLAKRLPPFFLSSLHTTSTKPPSQ